MFLALLTPSCWTIRGYKRWLIQVAARVLYPHQGQRSAHILRQSLPLLTPSRPLRRAQWHLCSIRTCNDFYLQPSLKTASAARCCIRSHCHAHLLNPQTNQSYGRHPPLDMAGPAHIEGASASHERALVSGAGQPARGSYQFQRSLPGL